MAEGVGGNTPEIQAQAKQHTFINRLRGERQPSDHLAAEFNKREDEIKSLYEQARYWHGTGRYRYQAGGTVPEDILQNIITSGGLMRDQNFKTASGEQLPAISLANGRMYSRWYAQINREAGTELGFQNGSQLKWYRKFMAMTVGPRMRKFASERLLAREKTSDTFLKERFMNRRNRINDTAAVGSLKHKLQNLADPQSSIKGNYGMLFGVKESAVTPDDFVPDTVKAIETRSLTDITWDGMTHVEVPETKVAETEAILRSYGIQLPVIPMELGEIYTTKFSDEVLLRGTPLVNSS